MRIRVGTFNLNNLFSRYNFQATVNEIPVENGGLMLSFSSDQIQVRSFMGRLVRAKDQDDTQEIARRIKEMNADVLAVQEVEHIEILKEFNKHYLDSMYKEVVLIEGNDQRLIDVGVLSKYPVGSITSHQAAVHEDDPNRRVFGRDLLQVEILDQSGRKLFNLYNTHLKSHYVPFGEDPVLGAQKANERRRRQSEKIAEIIGRQERPNSKYILTGDMNDPPESEFLSPMRTIDGRTLFNALESPRETRPAKAETPGQGDGPQKPSWTHRFNPPGPEPPHYALYDHIWLSAGFDPQAELLDAVIDRRKNHGGDGSDHDPAWIDLEV